VPAGAEEAWLDAALRDLRRLVPDNAAPASTAATAGIGSSPNLNNQNQNMGTPRDSRSLARAQLAFVRVVTRARLAMAPPPQLRTLRNGAPPRTPRVPLPALPLGSRLVSVAELRGKAGRGSHSSTLQLNLSAFRVTGGAVRGCFGGVLGVVEGIRGVFVCFCVRHGSS